MNFVIQAMDLVGDIYGIGFWVVLSGIGAGGIERDLQWGTW